MHWSKLCMPIKEDRSTNQDLPIMAGPFTHKNVPFSTLNTLFNSTVKPENEVHTHINTYDQYINAIAKLKVFC